jgi:hypothetical protein
MNWLVGNNPLIRSSVNKEVLDFKMFINEIMDNTKMGIISK